MKKLLCKPYAKAIEAKGKAVKATGGRSEKITCGLCGRRRFGVGRQIERAQNSIIKSEEMRGENGTNKKAAQWRRKRGEMGAERKSKRGDVE